MSESIIGQFDPCEFLECFAEGIYTNGRCIIEAWWDYDKTSVQIADDTMKGHTSVYPIAFAMLTKDYVYVGDV